MFNFYGPTETNVCTAHQVHEIDDGELSSVPIGVAACGDRVRTVRDDGSEAAEGEPGELWVDGPTVMLGYWGAEPHVGPYRTGDICRRRGRTFEFIGRRDQMVKIRGYRVELGEIEAVLSRHPSVGELAVVVAGEGVERRLICYVTPRQRMPTLLELKAFGATHLPPHMLVGEVRHIEKLPRTANGKVDRLRLSELAASLPESSHA